jgi:hypothetical protein
MTGEFGESFLGQPQPLTQPPDSQSELAGYFGPVWSFLSQPGIYPVLLLFGRHTKDSEENRVWF